FSVIPCSGLFSILLSGILFPYFQIIQRVEIYPSSRQDFWLLPSDFTASSSSLAEHSFIDSNQTKSKFLPSNF
ncbi:MAG: hypothetical protein R6U84_08240, partial [Candidatus Cloacimonadales bacterium]